MCITHLDDTRTCEREANRFAAALLMPEDTIRVLLTAHDIETAVNRMAVSVEALRWRLRELRSMESAMGYEL